MIMDGLDTLSQIALAHADQLAILEEVQRCTSQNIDAGALPEIPVDYDDILNTPEISNTGVPTSQVPTTDLNASLLLQTDLLQNKVNQHTAFNGERLLSFT